MGILSAMKTFAYDVLGIERDTKTNSADNTKKVQSANTPIIQVENQEKNEDTVKLTTSNEKPAPKKNLGQIKQSIEIKCQAYGINVRELFKGIGEIADISKEDFEALSETDKEEILNFLSYTVDKVIEQREKYGSSEQTKTEEVVLKRAKNTYSAVQAGRFKDAEEFENILGDINAELGEDFKEVSVKERRQRIEQNRMQSKKAFEARVQAELSKLPESERAEAEQRLREQYKFIQRGRFIDIVNVNDSETALQAIPVLSSDDIGYGAEVVIQSRSSQAEKTRTADMADFDFFEGLAQSYYNFGEELSSSSVESYTQTMTQYKSADALNQYQTDYATAREKYENGENVPPYMTKEIFAATAKGIGVGAAINVNMSSSEKTAFLSRWEKDAKQFNDTELIKEVKKQINVQSESQTESQTTKNERAYVQTVNSTIALQKEKTNEKEDITKDTKPTAYSKQDNQVTNPKVTNPIVRAETIKKNGLKEAKEIYSDKEILETVLTNQDLTYLRPQVASMLNSYSVNDLVRITEGCSTSAFLFVLRNITPEKASALYDNKKDLCYAGRKLGEQIIREDSAA